MKDEERLRLAIEGSGVGLWDWLIQANELTVNERWASMLGYNRLEIEPLRFESWSGRVHPDDLVPAQQLLEKCFNGELPHFSCEVRMRHKDGHWVWILTRGKVVEWDSDGRPLRMSGTHLDVSERKLTELALLNSERNLRTILDNTHDAIFIHTTEGKLLDVNGKMLEMHGVTKEKALTLTILEDCSAADNPFELVDDLWGRAINGEPVNFEWKGKRYCDGTTFDVEIALKRIILDNRPVILANVRDISARKATEAVLRDNEEKFRALVEHSPDAISRYDENCRHLYVNSVTAERIGMPREEFIGKTHRELGFPEHLCNLCANAIRKVFATGKVHRIEYLLPSGLWTDWMLMPELDEHGAVKAVITSARDITERKEAEQERSRLEEQLRHSQRIEAVGRLAGGIAHDFNNILNVILGHCELAMLKMAPDQPFYDRFEGIQAAARRSTELTRQLLAFARKQTISPRVLNLNETIKGMLNILQRLIGEDIRLAWLPGDNLWSIRVDPSQVDQILANLCVNARDAIDGVGRLTIELGNARFDDGYCLEHPGYIPGEFIMLAVSDDGSGMDQETQQNIFDPFFTTKELGKGTGLGLATVYGIVKQNNGFIQVFSEPGRGSTFRIYLPRYFATGDRQDMPPQDTVTVAGTETILLVEDEGEILEIGKMMLENLGYRVLAAATPDEAIEVAREHRDAIHLLITDVVMPDMNGRELSQQLISICPALKVLFMSGYTSDVIAHHGVLDEGVHFIHKPFSIQELGTEVRKTLDEGQ